MTKAELAALEKVYAAEIEGALSGGCGLFQSKAKVYRKLESEGYVKWSEEILGRDRFGAITVSGWSLTLLGNATYCFSCEGDDGN